MILIYSSCGGLFWGFVLAFFTSVEVIVFEQEALDSLFSNATHVGNTWENKLSFKAEHSKTFIVVSRNEQIQHRIQRKP